MSSAICFGIYELNLFENGVGIGICSSNNSCYSVPKNKHNKSIILGNSSIDTFDVKEVEVYKVEFNWLIVILNYFKLYFYG